MRVIDLMEILEKFRNKSELGYCQVRIVMPNDNYRKQYKIKEITFIFQIFIHYIAVIQNLLLIF